MPRRGGVSAALLILALGCENSLSVRDVAGTYDLVSYQGHPLPVGLGAPSACPASITSGTLQLNKSGSATISMTTSDCHSQVSHGNSSGTFEVANDEVVLTVPELGGTYKGHFTGATLVFVSPSGGEAWGFER
jgi:hypothetical protein